jgi:hypothetical protein
MSTVSPVRTSTVSFQTRFGSSTPSRARTRKAPGAVDVEGVRHRMVGVHLVDEADLDLIADANFQSMAAFAAPGVAVDELPAHVLCCRPPIHLDHVVFPLDAPRMVMAVRGMVSTLMFRIVIVRLLVGHVFVVPSGLRRVDKVCRHELHAALRTTVGRVAGDVWVHGADVARRSLDREELHSALGAATGSSLTMAGCIGHV